MDSTFSQSDEETEESPQENHSMINGTPVLDAGHRVTFKSRRMLFCSWICCRNFMTSFLTCGIPSEDRNNILLLLFLYMLQGIPLGLTASVPYILTSRHVSYTQQGTFSFAVWPFSMKLLWAPFVDCVYSTRLGRRKSWLIPVQYTLGSIMLVLSFLVSSWLGDIPAAAFDNFTTTTTSTPYINFSDFSNSTASPKPSVLYGPVHLIPLTITFFLLNFLTATQDIAVDGWALTMLQRKNIGWASTCNTVGQSLGVAISFMLFLALESKDFINRFRSEPKPYGLVTFGDFLLGWSVVLLVSNTLLLIFKKEEKFIPSALDLDEITAAPVTHEERTESPTSQITDIALDVNSRSHSPAISSQKSSSEKEPVKVHIPAPTPRGEVTRETSVQDISDRLSIGSTYLMMWRIVRLRSVQYFVLIVFLIKTGCSAADNLTHLKLIERGVPREVLALLQFFSLPFQCVAPLLMNRWVTGPHPVTAYMITAMPRTLFGFACVALVYNVGAFRQSDGTFTFQLYVLIATVGGFQQIMQYAMMACQMAFHARVSDPIIGGTYMTLLNTASNLANMVPNTVVLYLVDLFSRKTCVSGIKANNTCIGTKAFEACRSGGGTCRTDVEGYYILVGICATIGCVSIIVLVRLARRLEALPLSEWYVVPRKALPVNIQPAPSSQL